MSNLPPKHRRGTAKSLRRIAHRLGLKIKVTKDGPARNAVIEPKRGGTDK